MRHQTRSNKCYRTNNPNQATLWGDTYLTPLEASVYLKQMLQTLKRYRDKTERTK